MSTKNTIMRFALGQIVSTPGAMATAEPAELATMLQRHAAGDWGDICDEDKQLNDLSLKNGERILSSYQTKSNETIWLITEADRSVTTFLLPSEY